MSVSSYIDHFPPGSAQGKAIPEAPADGQLYGRENGAWIQVPPPGGTTAYDYSFNLTASAPPTGSQVRLNNVDQTAATLLWITYTTAPGADARVPLLLTTTGQVIYIQDKDNSTLNQVYDVTAPAVDQGNYCEIAVRWRRGGSPLLAQRVLVGVSSGASSASAFIFAADQAAVKTTPPQHGVICQSNADGTIYVTVNGAWVQINTTPF